MNLGIPERKPPVGWFMGVIPSSPEHQTKPDRGSLETLIFQVPSHRCYVSGRNDNLKLNKGIHVPEYLLKLTGFLQGFHADLESKAWPDMGTVCLLVGPAK